MSCVVTRRRVDSSLLLLELTCDDASREPAAAAATELHCALMTMT